MRARGKSVRQSSDSEQMHLKSWGARLRDAASVSHSLRRFELMLRHVRRIGIYLSLLFFLTSHVQAAPKDVTVRLVNARSGKPLSKALVTIFFWKGTWTFPHEPFPKHDDELTNDAGLAVFHLIEPLPEHLGFSIGSPWDVSGCCCHQNFSLETVLQAGVVAGYDESKCGKLKRQVSAKPGEVVIFEKKLTFWEKMRREIP